ncbi:MAG: hypothetical protein HQL98_15480 [Magnetococcales bacterium]|nr:hypothetical protein [Magnetococcales bacterium]
METQSVGQDQTATPLPQEMLEKLFCAIGEIDEQEEERNKTLIHIREVRKSIRTLKKEKKVSRKLLCQLKVDLDVIDDNLRSANMVIKQAEQAGRLTVVIINDRAKLVLAVPDEESSPLMQCANLTPTVPDDCPPPQ